MNNPLADPLYIPALFTHKFDIDTLVAAALTPHTHWLNTTDGTLTRTPPQGVPPSHVFELQPLPASLITELRTHPLRRQLNDADQTALEALLASLTNAPQLLPHLTATRLGGWLHERVKDVLLEWLDSHNLIPPSMRHINRRPAPTGTPTRPVGKVHIN